VNKRRAFNALKYALAAALLTWVLWSNWGDSRRVAATVAVGGAPAAGTVSGTVVAYAPGDSLTVAEASGQRSVFALGKRTRLVGPDGEPLPEGESLAEGAPVAVAEGPRGLAYVWQKHVTERKPVQGHYLLLAVAAFIPSIFLTFVRWYYLARAVRLPFRLPDALRLGFVGLFFNNFLPGAVGGDIIKAAFLAREQKRRRALAVATVVMDRGLALWALVWFVALSGAVFWAAGLLRGDAAAASEAIVKAAAGVVAVTLAAWLLLGRLSHEQSRRLAARLGRLPKVGHAAAELWLAVWVYRRKQATVFRAMLLSLASHVGFVLTFFFCALTLSDPADHAQKIPTLAEHFLIVPIGMIIRALPGLPGGAGLGELGFGGLYGVLGSSVAAGVLGALVQRLLEYLVGGVSGLLYLRMRATLPAARPAELAAAEA
jgi:uncharacterized protein (TIRG00374 family)